MGRLWVWVWALGMLTLSAPVKAQETGYSPDMLALDGETSLVFPTQARLSIWDAGTIEFWIEPDWKDPPAYHPVVLSNTGKDGTLYEIAMHADKGGLSLTSGALTADFDFNFGDGKVHHVALVNLGTQILALVDGRLQGSSALKLAPMESSQLRLGSGPGGRSPFYGVIAGLRIWDAAIDPETIIEYSLADAVSDTADHPYAAALAGYSAFAESDFYITDKAVVPTWLYTEEELTNE